MTPTYTVGIDVGTTFTAAATCRGGRTEVVTLGDRGDVIPSVAYLREDGELLVGDAAERRAVGDATRVARAFKRRIGDQVPLYLGDEPRSPEALTAAIVRSVVDLVTAREGGPPGHIVLTLPASWADHRRGLLLGAVADVGVEDVTLLAEPVAVAVHYASRHPLADGTTVGIYDLGGGTFDATIVRRTGDGFEIVGQPQGDGRLGGIDLDALVWDHVESVIGAEALDPGADPSRAHVRTIAQVRGATVDAKEALSYDTHAVVPVTLPGLMTEVLITRSEFEEMARPALMRTLEVLRRTCEAAAVAPGDLHAVLLAGGSSRIPLIAQLLGYELGAAVASDAHPKLATCLGAARAAESGAVTTAGGTAAAASPVLVSTVRPTGTDTGTDTEITTAPADGRQDPLSLPIEPVATTHADTTEPVAATHTDTTEPVAASDADTTGLAPATAPTTAGTDATGSVPAAVRDTTGPVPSYGDPRPLSGATGDGLLPPPADVDRGSAGRTRWIVAVAAATLVVAGVAAAVLLPDDPGEIAGPDGGRETTTSSTSTPTTTDPPVTTAPPTTTSQPVVANEGDEGGTPDTTVPSTTVPSTTPAPTPGGPCDPAAGDPDCTDSGGGTFHYVVGYADCIAESVIPETCADLDGDGRAGYPDSG